MKEDTELFLIFIFFSPWMGLECLGCGLDANGEGRKGFCKCWGRNPLKIGNYSIQTFEIVYFLRIFGILGG